MNFIEELKWRGMLHDMTPGVEELLQSQKVVGYIGFDPTAPSLTIGNFVQIQLLKLFQLHGHSPIVLLGGATGRIGDPSFKEKERELKSEDELDRNLNFQLTQFQNLLDFEGENGVIVVNNHDFYKEMNILEFMRNVGKTLTVSYMLSKDSVKNRLETGLSFTEFSYQLLQAYDFQVLYDNFGCVLQMGGSDQWGNITSGTEFIRRNCEGKAYAVTTPLLTKSDGKKFGKSEEGNVWLDPKLTSTYKFYQFWINVDDADLYKFLKYFTLKTQEEVIEIEEKFGDNPNEVKRILAEELTIRVHGKEALESAKTVSEILFNKNASRESIMQLTINDLEIIGEEIPSYDIKCNEIVKPLLDILTNDCNVFTSKSEGRRAFQNNAISINKLKISDPDYVIAEEELIHNQYCIIENGKKNKYLLNFKN
jgi:tyrosyl-tRNA synthetase